MKIFRAKVWDNVEEFGKFLFVFAEDEAQARELVEEEDGVKTTEINEYIVKDPVIMFEKSQETADQIESVMNDTWWNDNYVHVD